jgi:hypothetical protein
MARFDINQRIYQSVDPSTSVNLDYAPANGEKIFIVNMGVSSSQVPDTVACIAWGNPVSTMQILLSSYSEALHRDANIEIVGDGVKVLRIYLANDLTEPAYMGGFIQGVIL